MKKLKGIALISGLAFVAYLVYKHLNKNKLEPIEEAVNPVTLKIGSFSKEIENLQKNINAIVGSEVLEVSGAYSNKMKDVIAIVFKDTDALKDPLKGEIALSKLKELNTILNNINNQVKAK